MNKEIKLTPENISVLKPNEVFVFGQSYAVPTKDEHIETLNFQRRGQSNLD